MMIEIMAFIGFCSLASFYFCFSSVCCFDHICLCCDFNMTFDLCRAKIEKEKKENAKMHGMIRTEFSGGEIAEEMEKERRMFQLQMCEVRSEVTQVTWLLKQSSLSSEVRPRAAFVLLPRPISTDCIWRGRFGGQRSVTDSVQKFSGLMVFRVCSFFGFIRRWSSAQSVFLVVFCWSWVEKEWRVSSVDMLVKRWQKKAVKTSFLWRLSRLAVRDPMSISSE